MSGLSRDRLDELGGVDEEISVELRAVLPTEVTSDSNAEAFAERNDDVWDAASADGLSE